MSRILFLLLLSAVTLVLGTEAVQADDTRRVGDYTVTASFERSPVYPQDQNGFIVRVRNDAGPVSGLEGRLRVRVGVPNQVTETLRMEPLPGEPGAYRVNLFLPRAGDYFLDLYGLESDGASYTRFITGQNGLDKVISKGRQFPRGAGYVLLFTLGLYLVGLSVLVGRAAFKRLRRGSPVSGQSATKL